MTLRGSSEKMVRHVEHYVDKPSHGSERSKTPGAAASACEICGLKSFARDYPMASLYMFYGGDEKLFINDITLIPIEQALLELPSF